MVRMVNVPLPLVVDTIGLLTSSDEDYQSDTYARKV